MHFELLDCLSIPGDPAKPNEDSFARMPAMAVVVDGATGLGERLMPGASDAQWLAQFAAHRLRAHAADGGAPRDWLAAAARDGERSFEALRKRPPMEQYELPFASLMLAALREDALDFLWFGDCAALMRAPAGEFSLIGDTMEVRAKERERAARASKTPAALGVREEFLVLLRRSRNQVNTQGGEWLFAPDGRCVEHAQATRLAAVPGARLLLASDGFLALAADYRRYAPETLFDAALQRGLAPLGEELRAVEASDPDGRRFPRFKRSDDATALLILLRA